MVTTDLAHSVTAHGMGNMPKTSNPPDPEIYCQWPLHNPSNTDLGLVSAMREDFARVLSYIGEYRQRIDLVTTIISIGDNRDGLEYNQKVVRLTWFATFFIALSFLTGLFSMTDDVTTLHETMKWYFAAAIPLACMSLGPALVDMPSFRKWRRTKVVLVTIVEVRRMT
jgi:Mg2+ and Co2+ transporter CorA